MSWASCVSGQAGTIDTSLMSDGSAFQAIDIKEADIKILDISNGIEMENSASIMSIFRYTFKSVNTHNHATTNSQ